MLAAACWFIDLDAEIILLQFTECENDCSLA